MTRRSAVVARWLSACSLAVALPTLVGVAWNGDAPDRGVVAPDGLTDRVGPFHNTHTTRNETNGARGTGTLLNDRWVITARHCVQLGPDYGKIAPPERVYFDISGKRFYADAIFVAPYSDEIALVRLAEPVPNTRPIKLNDDPNEAGRVVAFGGYGRHGKIGGQQSGRVAFHRAYNIPFPGPRNKLHVKAEGGKQALIERGLLEGIVGPGDSGGPLFLFTGTADQADDWSKYTLAGIVAQGGDARWGEDSIFARISSHHEWITNTMRDNSPSTTKPTTAPATAPTTRPQ